MKNEDFVVLLRQLPIDPNATQRQIAAVLGVNLSIVNSMLKKPDQAVKDYHLRHVRFLLMLDGDLQHYLVSTRIERENPPSELLAFTNLNELFERVSKIGMTKNGFYQLMGINNSTFAHAKTNGEMGRYTAYLVEVLRLFEPEELTKLALEYEYVEKNIKRIRQFYEAHFDTNALHQSEVKE